MIQTAPSPIDLLDFQFKLQCRLKIFQNEDNSTFNKACNIVAVASKYGLLFVGTNSTSFQVIQLQGLRKYSVKDGEIGNYLRRAISLPAKPEHLSVNCDCTKLSVVVTENECVKAIIYDIPSFLQQNISISSEIRLSPTPGVSVVETVWNPTLPSVYTVCKDDGSLGVYDLKPTGVEINELPKTAGATCMCWSPKGKQIAVGSRDGKITQYKPDLKAAKVIEAPPLEGSQLPTGLQWISNYQFIAIYRAITPDAQCNLLVINCPKSAEVTYINYEDICYSYGSVRPYQFYMLLQNMWNVLLVASSNSMEVGVLGYDKDIWTQWILADSSRAELPLSSTKQDTFPIGLSLDLSSAEPVPWGESALPPAPAPLLLLLSDHGLLCCFHAVNLKEGAAQICRPAEILPNSSTMYFTGPPPVTGTQLPSKPVPINPTKQNIQPSVQQPAPTTFSFTFKQPSNSISTTANTFQQSVTQPFSFASAMTPPATKAEKTINQFPPSPFSASTKPTVATAPSETYTVSTDKSVPGNFPIKTQTVQPTIPEVKATANSAQPSIVRTPPRTDVQDVVGVNEDTESLIAQMVKEECVALESELKILLYHGQTVKVDLGTDGEATSLVQSTNSLQEFLDDINEICQTQSVEVHHLKQELIQTWAWYEEAKSRFNANKDPALITLMRAQPLDAASARQLEDIRHLLYYLESQLGQANAALDEQWETFQDSCKKKLSLKLPSIETIYQSMVKQSATIQKQVYILKDISNRIKARARSSTVPHLLVSLDGADKLEEQLKNLTIQPKDVLHLQYERVFKRQKQLSADKTTKLRNFLKNRNVVHVSVNKPQLSNSTIQLTGLANAPFSPIVASKKLQPQRLNFVQSTPKPADNNQLNNVELKKLQSKMEPPPIGDVIPEISKEKASPRQESKTIFETIATKSNDAPPPSVTPGKTNTFVFGDVKTSPGSAFVPTTQNLFGVKSGLFSDSTGKSDVAPPQKSIFSFNTPINSSINAAASAAPTVIFATPTTTLGNSTESVQKPLFATKPSSVAATVTAPTTPKLLAFGGTNSITATSSATNFSFANLSATAKVEGSAAPLVNIPNTKSAFGSAAPVATSASMFSTFKPLDNNSKSIFPSVFATTPVATKPANTNVHTPAFGIKSSNVPASATSSDPKAATVSANVFSAAASPIQIIAPTKVVEIPKVINTATPAPASTPLPINIGSSVTITPVMPPNITPVASIQSPPADLPTSSDTSVLGKVISRSVVVTATPQIITPIVTMAQSKPPTVTLPEMNKSSVFAPVTAESSTTTVTTVPSIFSMPVNTVSSSSLFNTAPFGGAQQPFSLFGSSQPQPSSSIFGNTTQKSTTTPATTNTWSILWDNANAIAPFGSANSQSPTGPSASVTKTTAPSIFNANSSNAATSIIQPSSIFGSPASSVFGSSATTATQSSPTVTQPSLYGSPTVTTTQPSIFASPIATTTQPTVFGTTAATTTPSSIFGSPTTNVTTTTTQATIFGAGTLTTSTTPGSVFGGSIATSPASQAPAFGASTTQASVFGTPTASSPSGSIFGTSSAATESIFPAIKSTTVGAFGSGSATFSTAATSAPSFFTPSSTTPSIFGQPATFGSGSIFSNTPSTNTGSIFGGGASSASPTTNAFGSTPTTNANFGTVFGSSTSNASPFGSTNDSFRFATTTGANTPSTAGAGFGFNKQAFTSFGGSSSASNTTDTNSIGFGNLGLSTSSQSSNAFANSGFGQNPFSRNTTNQEQKSPFSGGSIFGSSPTTTSSSSSSSNIFGGSSPFSKSTPAFGAPATFGSSSAFGQQPSSAFGQNAFGSSGNSVFGNSSQPGPFSRSGQTSVNQSGFGAAPVFGTSPAFAPSSPGGFGAPPAFGSASFGINSNFNAATKPFPDNTFGTSNQQNPTFANLANQTTLGFGSLAQQQNQTPTSQSTFSSGGSSFSNWR